VFQTCADTDGDDCLELTEERCSGSCDDDDGCVFTATCAGTITAVLRDDVSNGPYNTQNAGNEFSQFGCNGNGSAEDGPDLLFAVNVKAHTSVTVNLVGPDFENSAPTIFLVTNCGNNAEGTCADDSPTSVTRTNSGDETVRVYVIVDASGSGNFGTFGLTLNVRTLECGDGVVDSGEQCDDGNTEGGDGCTVNCRVSNGWACTSADPSVCTRRPTDGICGLLRCQLPADAPQGSQLCCTPDEACGLAYPPAYGAHCFELAQAGRNDNDCADQQSTQPLNWPQLDGCCRPDGYCGLTAGVGLGCVRRSEVWTALQDGPGGLYNGPFVDQNNCN
jgi:cysteine-rich repeat protein